MRNKDIKLWHNVEWIETSKREMLPASCSTELAKLVRAGRSLFLARCERTAYMQNSRSKSLGLCIHWPLVLFRNILYAAALETSCKNSRERERELLQIPSWQTGLTNGKCRRPFLRFWLVRVSLGGNLNDTLATCIAYVVVCQLSISHHTST